jgi:hypothetical protein
MKPFNNLRVFAILALAAPIFYGTGCGGEDLTMLGAGGAILASNSSATCPAPTSPCGTGCADTSTDPKNCGSCGKACAVGEACYAGACSLTCVGGSMKCGDVCVDTKYDPTNCGACGKACAADEVCSAGTCG